MKSFKLLPDVFRLLIVPTVMLFATSSVFAAEIAGVEVVEGVEVDFQTPYEDAMALLPDTVYVTLSQGEPVAADVEWELDQPWLLSTFGNYTAIGTVTLPEGVTQSDPPTPLEVRTTVRMNSGRDLMVLQWEGFNQPGRYVQETLDIGDGRRRVFYYYVPTSYDADEPIPVMFDLHGGGSNGLAQWGSSRSDRFAEQEGFISIAPNNHTPEFMAAILDQMESLYNIDTRRVYSMGVSMGGIGTTRAGVALPDRIAGMGIVAGHTILARMQADDVPLPRPMPVVLIGGSKDSTSGPPWRNLIPGTLQAAEWVADQAGCSTRKPMEQVAATPENLDLRELPLWTSREDALLIQQHYPTSADIHAWTDCEHGYEIVAYGIQGGGHVWPGGNQFVTESTVGPATHIIDATRVIWDHLSQFTLP